jgi:tyrosyl-tRNA synthetase
VVTDFYGAEAAAQAEAAVRTRHAVRTGGRELDADLVKSLPPVDVAGPPERHLLRRVLVEDLKAASSMSDATRKVQQGAVRVDGEVVKDIAFLLPPGQHLIQVGKRSLSRVNVLPEPSSPLGD